MKIVTSSCEKNFILQNITKGLRLDGRSLHDGRSLEIVFGAENGCCIVILGNTRVLAQVSCEVTLARPGRPAEGILHVNLELSPMAAPNFAAGKMSEEGVEATRLLERCIRDSKCIDLETLCIVAGLKVWTVRVDVQALNNDGNLIECASIAAISALAHFKRPDITVVGTDITVHSIEDHNPVPLSIHHMPVIINLAVYEQGEYILVDPVDIEERVAEGKITFGVNAHQELCSLHLSGGLLLKQDTVLRCSDIAVKRAQMVTQVIRAALEDYAYRKKTNKPVGFCNLLQTGTILGAKHPLPQLTLTAARIQSESVTEKDESDVEETVNDDEAPPPVVNKVRKFLRKPEIAIFQGGPSKWQDVDESEEDDEIEEMDQAVDGNRPIKSEEESESSSDSDEEEIEEKAVLPSDQLDAKDSVKSRGWFVKNPF